MKVIIKPNCRKVHGGNTEAFEVAIKQIKERYDIWVDMPLYEGMNFIIELRVEKPLK